MLEQLRRSGKPIPPHVEKVAAWMDKVRRAAGMDGACTGRRRTPHRRILPWRLAAAPPPHTLARAARTPPRPPQMHAESQQGGAGGDAPMVKPGDASMASPFTAKASSVAPVTDILKQGRCTLVTTVQVRAAARVRARLARRQPRFPPPPSLTAPISSTPPLTPPFQMFKILGLLCLSTAYALSVMYLQGVKLSDTQVGTPGGFVRRVVDARRAGRAARAGAGRGRRARARRAWAQLLTPRPLDPTATPQQATLSGVLTAGMFFFISNAKPLEALSPTRPHPSIFNVYFFGSLIGQFAAQLGFLIWMYRWGAGGGAFL
jgi:hypothetical protein